MNGDIIEFPGFKKTPTRMSWWTTPVGEYIRRRFAAFLKRIGVLGLVREMSFYDSVSDQYISITPKNSGYIVTINGRDYFYSLTGTKQGTGSGV